MDPHAKVTECCTATCAPEPDRAIIVGELLALLVTVTLPDTTPAPAGANVTLKVALWPGIRICPVDRPLALNPGPATLTFETATLEFPVFVSVTEWPLLLLTLTLPKFTLDGLGANDRVAEFTVSGIIAGHAARRVAHHHAEHRSVISACRRPYGI